MRVHDAFSCTIKGNGCFVNTQVGAPCETGRARFECVSSTLLGSAKTQLPDFPSVVPVPSFWHMICF